MGRHLHRRKALTGRRRRLSAIFLSALLCLPGKLSAEREAASDAASVGADKNARGGKSAAAAKIAASVNIRADGAGAGSNIGAASVGADKNARGGKSAAAAKIAASVNIRAAGADAGSNIGAASVGADKNARGGKSAEAAKSAVSVNIRAACTGAGSNIGAASVGAMAGADTKGAAGTAAAEYSSLGVSGADRPEVEALRRKYLTTHRQWLSDVLENAGLYRVYVRRRLEERGMPAFLEYLPVVESDYLPTARSASGAAGMWQFMENSVRPFLRCDSYVDERLDPWKSTDAALSKLQDNYGIFGDWLLAVAAYNCGAGATARALKKSPEKNFWYLAEHGLLGSQAAQYVPKLLAVADIVTNQDFYGASFPDIRGEEAEALGALSENFDYVTVAGAVPMSRLAQELRIDEEILRSLNRPLLRGVTPPDSEYAIRLLPGMRDAAVRALRSMDFFATNAGAARR